MVDKITGVISPLEEVEKINEIIDNLGGKEIGEIFYSLTPQTGAGYHLADGTLISAGTYAAFVEHMADLYEAEANCFCTEAEWQTSITTYGACGKFVYDSENNTVRLPKVTGFVEGTIDANTLGDLVEAGLPDHAHSYAQATFNQGRGGEYPLVSASNVGATTGNASDSNPIYGNSSTVQPQSILGYVYIVISNVTKTAIQSDIDEIATDLNGKADVDLSNMNASQTAKDTIIGWGMPDYANGVSKVSNTTYTADVSGLLYLYSQGGDSSNVYNILVIDGITFQNRHQNSGYTNFYSNTLIMYVEKGSTYTPTCTTCTFYPLKGAN